MKIFYFSQFLSSTLKRMYVVQISMEMWSIFSLVHYAHTYIGYQLFDSFIFFQLFCVCTAYIQLHTYVCMDLCAGMFLQIFNVYRTGFFVVVALWNDFSSGFPFPLNISWMLWYVPTKRCCCCCCILFATTTKHNLHKVSSFANSLLLQFI